MNLPLFKDFCVFARAQIVSGDIDPMYPVLRRFYERNSFTREQALWRTVLYVTWYHVGSAEAVWNLVPEPTHLTDVEVVKRSTGTERRGFRGNVLALKFVNGLLERAGGDLVRWVDSFGEGEAGWDRAREEIQAIPYGGPWASYKFADLLKHVHGQPITASDIGVGGRGETAGPIPGMVRLTGEPWQTCASDVKLQKKLLTKAKDADVPFNGLDQLETALCDFNSLCKGSYYVGHDIDTQMEHLTHVRGRELWNAREVFPSGYRGEIGGWVGVRKKLKTVYRDQGRIIT